MGETGVEMGAVGAWVEGEGCNPVRHACLSGIHHSEETRHSEENRHSEETRHSGGTCRPLGPLRDRGRTHSY